jgi:hypothetical protein
MSGPSTYDLHAPQLLARGFFPLSIGPGTKKPQHFVPSLNEFHDTAGWTHPARRPETSPQPGAGIGVRLGKQTDGTYVIALDWDNEDAAIAAMDEFPPTVTKEGRRGFTAFYRSSNPIPSRDFKLRGHVAVQVLSDGRQTVVPPSVHPDIRRPYTWTSEYTLYSVSTGELLALPGDYVEKIESILRPLGYEATPRPESGEQNTGDSDDCNPFQELNNLALRDLAAWVPDLNLYGCRRRVGRTGSYEAVAIWRPSSTGRPLEERKRNLHISGSRGIKDFGTGEGFSPINLVMRARTCARPDAVAWLEQRLQPKIGPEIDFEALANTEKAHPEAPRREGNTPTSKPSLAFFASFALDDAAFYGLPGEIVRTIEPHSEADPVALLIQVLTLSGNIIGQAPYYQVESDSHHGNLFCVLVGDSSKARKGTSLGRIRAVAKVADENWADDRLKNGLSSGEGLINEVRDAVHKWDAKEKCLNIVDPGVTDKRLMIVEPEFAGALAAAERHGNTLSPLIRRAWDGGKLSTLTKSSPLCATGAHISIVGHITEDELRSRITRVDMANGFANRFLFALIRRSKELPFGGDLSDSKIVHLGEKLRDAASNAKSIGRVTMRPAAREKWMAVYGALSAAQPGLLGAVTARAEAQTIRLALQYALLDGKDTIDVPHLEAGLALWEYCEASAAHIFGDAIGDPIADEILRALRSAPKGMSRTDISNLFGRHKSSNRIGAALQLLATKGLARFETTVTNGRSEERWFALRGRRHG